VYELCINSKSKASLAGLPQWHKPLANVEGVPNGT